MDAKLSVPRLELGIFRVLGERHNQLDHTDAHLTEPVVVEEFSRTRDAKRKEYLTGFEPATPRSEVWCAVHCATSTLHEGQPESFTRR